ncbi:hypothetical protein [Solicola sp. PLA-1-18]|uniref:hypothetical protein n=1 Tax=Solicola sp. PLA-1-18 TaxID=3380532 RepID=UPI003B7B43B8
MAGARVVPVEDADGQEAQLAQGLRRVGHGGSSRVDDSTVEPSQARRSRGLVSRVRESDDAGAVGPLRCHPRHRFRAEGDDVRGRTTAVAAAMVMGLALAGPAGADDDVLPPLPPDHKRTPYPRTGINPAPKATIAGPRTRLYFPGDCERDRDGNLWVTNVSAPPDYTPEILVFGPDADGDVAPQRIITTPDIASVPTDLTPGLDGRIWAASSGSRTTDGHIRAYESGLDGAPAPSLSIEPMRPSSLEFDAAGNMHVVEIVDDERRLRVYAPGARSRADLRVLADQDPRGRGVGLANLTWTGAGELVTTSSAVSTNSISVHRPYLSGEQVPLRAFGGHVTETAGAYDVAVDRAGNMYVVAGSGYGTLAVHRADASGSPEPIVTLGAIRRFDSPDSVTVDRRGEVTVCFTPNDDPKIEVFDPVVPQPVDRGEPFPARPTPPAGFGAVVVPQPAPAPPVVQPVPAPGARTYRPARVTRVKATRPTTRRVLLTWPRPRATSERPVEGYVVRVSRRGHTVATFHTDDRRVVLSGRRLGAGKVRVAIRAVNRAGSGSAFVRVVRLR